MAVKIGSARLAENGSLNGKAGDQNNGKEVSTQNWYLHKKGWVLIRVKDAKKREKCAVAMQAACDNNHFGYGQNTRLTGYNEAKKYDFNPAKVTKDVNIDCSELVRLCLAYAGITVPDWYTGNMKSICKGKTATFEVIEGTKAQTDKYLLRGDILVTKTKGHTVIVLSNGSEANAKPATSVNTGGSLAAPGTKSIAVIAKEVIDGKWGSGSTRKKKLTEAGYNYDAVQAEVNKILKKKTIPEIAKEVIDGKWGSGSTRKKKLTEAGYDYDAVQKEVNKILKK